MATPRTALTKPTSRKAGDAPVRVVLPVKIKDATQIGGRCSNKKKCVCNQMRFDGKYRKESSKGIAILYLEVGEVIGYAAEGREYIDGSKAQRIMVLAAFKGLSYYHAQWITKEDLDQRVNEKLESCKPLFEAFKNEANECAKKAKFNQETLWKSSFTLKSDEIRIIDQAPERVIGYSVTDDSHSDSGASVYEDPTYPSHEEGVEEEEQEDAFDKPQDEAESSEEEKELTPKQKAAQEEMLRSLYLQSQRQKMLLSAQQEVQPSKDEPAPAASEQPVEQPAKDASDQAVEVAVVMDVPEHSVPVAPEQPADDIPEQPARDVSEQVAEEATAKEHPVPAATAMEATEDDVPEPANQPEAVQAASESEEEQVAEEVENKPTEKKKRRRKGARLTMKKKSKKSHGN